MRTITLIGGILLNISAYTILGLANATQPPSWWNPITLMTWLTGSLWTTWALGTLCYIPFILTALRAVKPHRAIHAPPPPRTPPPPQRRRRM